MVDGHLLAAEIRWTARDECVWCMYVCMCSPVPTGCARWLPPWLRTRRSCCPRRACWRWDRRTAGPPGPRWTPCAPRRPTRCRWRSARSCLPRTAACCRPSPASRGAAAAAASAAAGGSSRTRGGSLCRPATARRSRLRPRRRRMRAPPRPPPPRRRRHPAGSAGLAAGAATTGCGLAGCSPAAWAARSSGRRGGAISR